MCDAEFSGDAAEVTDAAGFERCEAKEAGERTQFMEAVVAGYEMGKRAEPLFGVDWSALWGVPIDEVRTRFGVVGARLLGEGIRTAA